MPETPRVVVDSAVAGAAGISGCDLVVVVATPERRRGSRAAGLDAAVDAVASATPGALVLARPPWADGAAAPLAALGVLLGCDVVWLPSGLVEAGWATALIVTWSAQSRGAQLMRRAQVAVGLAALPACRLPRMPWGVEALAMPAVGADALSRWCDRAWVPCERCELGGGAPGGPCARCGHSGVAA